MAYRPQGGYPCTNIMLRLSQRPTISCYRYQLCTYGQETCSSWSSTTVRPFSTTLRSCGPLYVPLRTSPALNSLQIQLQIRTPCPLWLLLSSRTPSSSTSRILYFYFCRHFRDNSVLYLLLPLFTFSFYRIFVLWDVLYPLLDTLVLTCSSSSGTLRPHQHYGHPVRHSIISSKALA